MTAAPGTTPQSRAVSGPPGAAPAARVASPKQDIRGRLANACQGRIKPVDLTLGYRLSLAAVAAVFVLLVSIYFFALTALTITLLSYVLQAFWNIVQLELWSLALTILPLIVGVSVWLAMIKPLLSHSKEPFQAFDLAPHQEPVFFEYVQIICQAVHAPAPYRISVDMSPNASASLVGGWWDSRLRLTVGLPLILGLNSRQLGGVIAHEFAHFRQRSGMRWTYIIRSLNHWFAQIFFERDSWDEFLQRKAAGGGLSGVLVSIAQMVVSIVRFGFMGLFFVSHFLTSKLLRQMEFDADRCEARLAGSQVFAQTSRRLRLLGICEAAAAADITRFSSEDKLVDNMPALVVASVDRIPPDKFRELERAMLQAQTEWHDSHPSDRERIDNIAREQALGIFSLEVPSDQLLMDSEGLCRALTLEHYRRELGADFDAKRVQNTAKLVQQRKRETVEQDAAERFFLNQISGLRSLELPRYQLGAALDPKQFTAKCSQIREQLRHQSAAYIMSAKREDQIHEQIKELEIARRWLEAKEVLPSGICSLPVTNLHEVNVHRQNLEFELSSIREQASAFRQLQGRRMLDDLEMLRVPSIVSRLKLDTSMVAHVNSVLLIWANFCNQIEFLKLYSWDWFTLKSYCEAAVNDVMVSDAAIRTAMERMQSHFAVFPRFTSQLPYPFEHAKGAISISQYLVPQVPPADDFSAIMDAGSTLYDNLAFLLGRCLSRLAWLAESVEKAHGLEPI